MTQPQTQTTLTDRLIEFYQNYYRDEIGILVQRYPKEQKSLEVSWKDVHQFDPDIADDYLDYPGEMSQHFEEALALFDLPIDIDLTHASVRLSDLASNEVFLPSDLTTQHKGYVGVTGDLSRVTTKDEVPTVAVFECRLCGTTTQIPQDPGDFQEPHQCSGCERKGPFEIVDTQTEWEDYCKVRIETPPEKSGSPQGEHIDGYAVGEPVHFGGEHGLLGRAGERVTVYGTIERVRKDKDDSLFERRINVQAVEFPNDDEDIDVKAHKETFEELATQDNAVDLLSESIAPALYATDAWGTAMEWAVAYLFGAPRIELDDGTVYRGDIHGAIISDYGMGKSMFSHGLENLSPECIRKSATSLSSDVGLTAAAVRDDFAGSQWTLKPGILVRGDGGHVILDEIDKGPDKLHKINDAIEGQQRVDVEKAGLSATYSSKVGLLVLGNPNEGRFDHHEPVSKQIGVDPSLLSRFDGIITMRDIAQEEIDEEIAQQIAEGYAEANQLRYGDLDEDDFEALDRPVEPEIARAWIKYAREEVNPVFGKDLIEDIRDWYASEVRQLNHDEDDDKPVPVTARVVMWVIRFSVAYARCHLRETVTETDVDRATKLAKRLIQQNWDGEQFVPEHAKGLSQEKRIKSITQTIEDSDDHLTIGEIVEATRISESVVEKEIEKLSRKGAVYEPQTGKYEVT